MRFPTLEQCEDLRILRQCENCGEFGFVGKGLIRHDKGKNTEKILCHPCHLNAHQIKKDAGNEGAAK